MGRIRLINMLRVRVGVIVIVRVRVRVRVSTEQTSRDINEGYKKVGPKHFFYLGVVQPTLRTVSLGGTRLVL